MTNDTDDRVLADALVEMGILGYVEATRPGKVTHWYVIGTSLTFEYVDRLVRDWRVAGEVLKRWPTTINTEHLDMTLDEMLRDPRAIIEAGVRAFTG